MKVILAITAASGARYARLTAERLASATAVDSVAIILSRQAASVLALEGETLPECNKFTYYDNDNLFAPPASGSARYDVMIVVPASVGTVGRVASGVSQTLIERAADVMLKERRRLLIVLRETPLSLIHLRNLTTLTECGAVILPASPSFYTHPQTLDELCMTVVERIMSFVSPDEPHYEWGSAPL
jgi:4-hydroxy-3-polyprenylbenzoate decarboxylase